MAEQALKEAKMTLIVKALSRLVAPSLKRGIPQSAAKVKRYFSQQATPNSLIGHAPSQPALPGEPGYNATLKSIELASKYPQGTILTHADMAKLVGVQSQEANAFLRELMASLKETNAEIRLLNKNLYNVVSVITGNRP